MFIITKTTLCIEYLQKLAKIRRNSPRNHTTPRVSNEQHDRAPNGKIQQIQ